MIKWQWLKVLQRQEVTVIKNKGILKYLLMMVVSLFLILNFSIGVSASGGYDRQEVDTCITISQRLSVKGGSGKPIQVHHYATDKSKVYTDKFKAIMSLFWRKYIRLMKLQMVIRIFSYLYLKKMLKVRYEIILICCIKTIGII